MHIPGTELDVSALCIGGSVFGWTADSAESHRLLDSFVAHGGNLVSSAANYSEWADGNVGGESESIIGSWFASRRRRDALIICTKQGLPFGQERGGFSGADLLRRTDLALARLQTDYIDIVSLQCLPSQEPLDEAFEACEKLVAAGKVRYLGASNMSPAQLRAAGSRADRLGAPRIRVLENHYSLLSRSKYEGELQATCEEQTVFSLPYWGLEKGFLTGKYSSGAAVDSPRVKRYNPASYVSERSLAILRLLDEIGQETGTSAATVALLWLKRRSMVASVMASARNHDQLRHLLPVLTLNLNQSQMERLTAVSRGEQAPLPGAVG